MADHVAKAELEIEAPRERVWSALTDPNQIEKYMFGSKVETDWAPGSSIVWRGEYEGKQYVDRGKILEVEPGRRLKMTHFSPLAGQEDAPENYHTLLYELESSGERTRVSLSQDNNPTEEAAEHSRANWETMLSLVGARAASREPRCGTRRTHGIDGWVSDPRPRVPHRCDS